MDEVTLPPLPEPAGDIALWLSDYRCSMVKAYTAEQMAAYAQQAASAAVLQERARAEKDAMRYRWLRKAWFSISAMTKTDGHALNLEVTGGWPGEPSDNERLDDEIDAQIEIEHAAHAAIDAAIRAEPAALQPKDVASREGATGGSDA